MAYVYVFCGRVGIDGEGCFIGRNIFYARDGEVGVYYTVVCRYREPVCGVGSIELRAAQEFVPRAGVGKVEGECGIVVCEVGCYYYVFVAVGCAQVYVSAASPVVLCCIPRALMS